MGMRRTADYEVVGRTILAYLRDSKKQMTAEELAKLFGLRSKTIARKIVKEMRAKGALICSNHDGYYYSTDEQDVQETVDMLEAMTNGLHTTVTNLNLAYVKYKQSEYTGAEQLTIF
jgi:biotin operon repressor